MRSLGVHSAAIETIVLHIACVTRAEAFVARWFPRISHGLGALFRAIIRAISLLSDVLIVMG